MTLFNRPILAGVYQPSQVPPDRTTLQAAVASFYSSGQPSFESFGASQPIHGYSNSTFPLVSAPGSYLAIHYYDNYNFITPVFNAGNGSSTTYNYTLAGISSVYNYGSPQAPQSFPRVLGSLTGTRINILGTNNYLSSVIYYDNKGRVAQTVSQNHLGGIDRNSLSYDFTGKMLERETNHNNGSVAFVTKRRMQYDHSNRLVREFHSIQSSSEVLLLENSYNEIGKKKIKKLHSRSSEPFLQSVDYKYNIRGWVEKINDPAQPLGDDAFSLELSFESPSSGSAQHNGNISEMIWAAVGSDKQSYGYEYDKINRFKKASYHNEDKPLQDGRYDEIVEGANGASGYDLKGNITRFKRYGFTAPQTFGLMDDLTYTYSQGNNLSKVDDAISTQSNEDGFAEIVENSGDYAYNKNGSLTKDENRGITSITYNIVNLPQQVNKGASEYTVFTYDATGRKLRQETHGSVSKTIDYLGEFVYQDNSLHSINHEEGRIMPDASPGAPGPWEYQYFLKDHLGNNRVTISERSPVAEYNSTLENNTQEVELQTFGNYGSRSNFPLFNHTAGGTYSQVLTGAR